MFNFVGVSHIAKISCRTQHQCLGFTLWINENKGIKTNIHEGWRFLHYDPDVPQLSNAAHGAFWTKEGQCFSEYWGSCVFCILWYQDSVSKQRTQVAFLWAVTPCIDVVGYRHVTKKKTAT
jgi:hypothetical protein